MAFCEVCILFRGHFGQFFFKKHSIYRRYAVLLMPHSLHLNQKSSRILFIPIDQLKNAGIVSAGNFFHLLKELLNIFQFLIARNVGKVEGQVQAEPLVFVVLVLGKLDLMVTLLLLQVKPQLGAKRLILLITL